MNAEEMRQAIIDSDDGYREPLNVEVPWNLGGEKLYVRRLDYGAIKPWLMDGNLVVSGDVVPKLVVRALVTENGRRIFKDGDAKHLEAKDHDLVTRIFGEVLRVGGFNQKGQEDVEESFAEARSEEPFTG